MTAFIDKKIYRGALALWRSPLRFSSLKRLKNISLSEVLESSSLSWKKALTLETSASESLYGGQFTLSIQLIKPIYLMFLYKSQTHLANYCKLKLSADIERAQCMLTPAKQ